MENDSLSSLPPSVAVVFRITCPLSDSLSLFFISLDEIPKTKFEREREREREMFKVVIGDSVGDRQNRRLTARFLYNDVDSDTRK